MHDEPTEIDYWSVIENTVGTDLIRRERLRQAREEGLFSVHDDAHTDDELAFAAVSYALPPSIRKEVSNTEHPGYPPVVWPWEVRWWKPTPSDRIKELVKAGALIAAEIDRQYRLKIDDINKGDSMGTQIDETAAEQITGTPSPTAVPHGTVEKIDRPTSYLFQARRHVRRALAEMKELIKIAEPNSSWVKQASSILMGLNSYHDEIEMLYKISTGQQMPTEDPTDTLEIPIKEARDLASLTAGLSGGFASARPDTDPTYPTDADIKAKSDRVDELNSQSEDKDVAPGSSGD